MNNHYSPFNLVKDTSVYTPTQTFNPKALVTLEYGEDTYIGTIGFNETVNNNGLIGFDFNLAEGEGASSCKIEVFDEDRSLANILFKYVDSINGLTPVVVNESSGVSSGSGCWLIPCSGVNDNTLHNSGLYGDRNGKHRGVDIGKNNAGDAIYAAKEGTVSSKYFQAGGAGNAIHLKHSDGYETRYFHMNAPSNLNEGDSVTAGQQIGTVGTTGRSQGVHLHFEVLKNGSHINPADVIPDLGKRKQKVVAKTEVCSNDSVSTNLSGEVSSNGKFNISKDQSIALLIQTALDNGMTDKGQIAYLLGTTEIETNFIYSEEINKPSHYNGGAQYYGRGYIQVTHKSGYERAGKELGLDLVNKPELATKPGVAASIAVLGLRDGWFGVGKPISHYIKGDNRDFYNARQTVNPKASPENYQLVAEAAERFYAKIDDLLAGKTASSSSSNSSVDTSGTTVASSTPNGGQITIELYLDDPDLTKPRKVVYTFIHVGVDYAENGRKVTIFGQSVAFKMAQKLVNTAYTDVTLQQIFTDFANRTNSELEMADDGIVYDYFPVNGRTPWNTITTEAHRRGYTVTTVNGKIKVQTLKEKKSEILSEANVNPLNTASNQTKDIVEQNKIYVLRNGFNSGLDLTISHKAESHNGGGSSDDSSSTSIDANAKTQIDPLTGELQLTPDGQLKGIKDGIYVEGSNVPKLKPIYKQQNTSTNNEANETSYTKYSSFVWITDSGETNNQGNRIWKVEVISNSKVIGTFKSLSGRANTQELNRNEGGNHSPSPDGEYIIGTPTVGVIPETGGVFLPYTPEFKTSRKSLGFHYDPSWGLSNGEDGTSGCHAFKTLDEYNQFKNLIQANKIDKLVIQAGGATTTEGTTSNPNLTDASNKDDLNRIGGITLSCSLPIDSKLLVLRPTDLVKTEGYGVDKFRTRIKRNTEGAVDYLDRIWMIQSISHSFYPSGYTTDLNCKSPFRAKLETIETEVKPNE